MQRKEKSKGEKVWPKKTAEIEQPMRPAVLLLTLVKLHKARA